MTTEGGPGTATSVVIPIMVPPMTDESRQSCLYLTTFVELFMWDQSPAQALCSLLAMCWFWPSNCEAEEKDLFLGSALLSLGRLVKDKLACLAQDVAACLSCQRDAKGDKQPMRIYLSQSLTLTAGPRINGSIPIKACSTPEVEAYSRLRLLTLGLTETGICKLERERVSREGGGGGGGGG
ncbi:hypothetical protein INR49_002997 [Caranx melampygus]|nr:hypothetical protein INR49_002997 [Caranx melampygus]